MTRWHLKRQGPLDLNPEEVDRLFLTGYLFQFSKFVHSIYFDESYDNGGWIKYFGWNYNNLYYPIVSPIKERHNMLKELLMEIRNINIYDERGWSPMMYALKIHDPKAVEMLIKHPSYKPDFKPQNRSDKTSLDFLCDATSRSNFDDGEIAQLLVESGVKPVEACAHVTNKFVRIAAGFDKDAFSTPLEKREAFAAFESCIYETSLNLKVSMKDVLSSLNKHISDEEGIMFAQCIYTKLVFEKKPPISARYIDNGDISLYNGEDSVQVSKPAFEFMNDVFDYGLTVNKPVKPNDNKGVPAMSREEIMKLLGDNQK
jgi:hypothetical protein